MQYLGIDPGTQGGLALLRDDGSVLAESMPVHSETQRAVWGSPIDFHALFCLIRDWSMPRNETRVVVEHVHSMPKQGVASTFTFGGNYAGILAVLQSLSIPYTLVRANVWKRKLGLFGAGKGEAIAFVQARFPALDLRRTSRSHTPHDGKSDAVCLAYYGQTQVKA